MCEIKTAEKVYMRVSMYVRTCAVEVIHQMCVL